jgi:hypothetical protein
VGVSDDVLAFAMVDAILSFYEVVIDGVLVGENLELILSGVLADNGLYRARGNVVHDFGYYVALALYEAHYGDFRLEASALVVFGFLVLVLVLFLSADVGFVNFDLAGKDAFILHVDFADSVVEKPCCFLSNTDHFGKLDAGNAFLRSRKKIDSKKPLVERELRLSKDRTSTDGEFQATVVAFVGFTIGEGVYVLASAMRAIDTIGKALGGKMFNASIFGGELLVKLLY